MVKKPSLLTKIKTAAAVIGTTEISKRSAEDDQQEFDDENCNEFGKRFKVSPESPLLATAVLPPSDQPTSAWTPKLAWKTSTSHFAKPPTPMLIKARRALNHVDASDVVEPPKVSRFTITPQLPGVRQALSPFASPKVSF